MRSRTITIKWAVSVKLNRQERTVIRSSPRRSHQSNGSVENYQKKQLQGRMRTMLAAFQDRTQYRPTTDSALMKWIVRRAAWLIPRFRGDDVQSPFYRAMGGPYRGKLLEVGESVLALPSRGGKRIWESRAEAGRQMELRRVADVWLSIWSELTKELKTRKAYDDSPRPAGQKKTF